jgi:hypothetical protein
VQNHKLPAVNGQNMLKLTIVPDLSQRDSVKWVGTGRQAAIVGKAIDLLTNGIPYPNYFDMFRRQADC